MSLGSLKLQINCDGFSTAQCSEGPIRCSFSNQKQIRIVTSVINLTGIKYLNV